MTPLAHRISEEERAHVRDAVIARTDHVEKANAHYAHTQKVEAKAEHLKADYRWQDTPNPDYIATPEMIARTRAELRQSLVQPLMLAIPCPLGHAILNEPCFCSTGSGVRGYCGARLAVAWRDRNAGGLVAMDRNLVTSSTSGAARRRAERTRL